MSEIGVTKVSFIPHSWYHVMSTERTRPQDSTSKLYSTYFSTSRDLQDHVTYNQLIITPLFNIYITPNILATRDSWRIGHSFKLGIADYETLQEL